MKYARYGMVIVLAMGIMSSCGIQEENKTKQISQNEHIEDIEELKRKKKMKDNEEVPEETVNTTKDNPINQPVISPNVEEGKRLLLMEDVFVQETNYYCAPAIVKSMLQHVGIEKSQRELAKELHTSPKTGSEYEDIARVVNQYIFGNSTPSTLEDGYHVQTLTIQDTSESHKQQWLERMTHNIEDGYPSILALDLQALYPGLGSANHVVLCVGFRTKPNTNELEYMYLLDPYYGVQDPTYGGQKIFTPDEVWNAIISNVEPAYIW